MEMRDRVVLLIPAYRPGDALLNLLEAMIPHAAHIVVVDDGNGVEYQAFFSQIEQKGVRVIHHAINMGKGRALKSGLNDILRQAIPHCLGVVTADADGQHTPNDIVRMMEALEQEPETFILGGRQFAQMPLRSRMGNTITRMVFRLTTGLTLSDTQTGLRALPYACLPDMLGIAGERYEYEMNVLLSLASSNIPYKEIEIETVYFENNRNSHFRTLHDGIRVFAPVLRYGVAAGASFFVDYALYIGLLAMKWAVLPPSVCFVLARAGSAGFNYCCNRFFVFRKKNTGVTSLVLYALLVMFGMLVGFFGIRFLDSIGVRSIAAKVIIDVVLFFFNFTMQRAFVFIDRGQNKEKSR